jgi:hypothetical protein
MLMVKNDTYLPSTTTHRVEQLPRDAITDHMEGVLASHAAQTSATVGDERSTTSMESMTPMRKGD